MATKAREEDRQFQGLLTLTTLSLWAQRRRWPDLHVPPCQGRLLVIPSDNLAIQECMLRIAQVAGRRGKRVFVRYLFPLPCRCSPATAREEPRAHKPGAADPAYDAVKSSLQRPQWVR